MDFSDFGVWAFIGDLLGRGKIMPEHPGLSAFEQQYSTPIGVWRYAQQHETETAFQGMAGIRRAEQECQQQGCH